MTCAGWDNACVDSPTELYKPMKHLLGLTTWNRREHFAFFSAFEEPFFGLVVTVDCTRALAETRQPGVILFLSSLYELNQGEKQFEERGNGHQPSATA
jgi:chloramphenicol O-acetyltransferase